MNKKITLALVLLALALVAATVWRWTAAPDEPPAADVTLPPADAASRLAEAMAPRAPSSATWELCGAPSIPQPAGRPSSPAEVLAMLPPVQAEEALAALRQRTVAKLQLGDARAQGAAIILRDGPAASAGQRAMVGPALARLARESDDATVMGWAVSQCARTTGPDACGGLDPSDWMSLEPDNAAASMVMLDQEADARDEVLRSLPRARKYALHTGQLVAAVIAATPPDAPGYLRLALALEVSAAESALLQPLLQGVAEACRQPAAAGGCDALARLMTERSDSLLAHQVGQRVAQLAGWPAARLSALKTEGEALRAAVPALDAQQPFACVSVETRLRWFEEVAREGELASLRKRLK